MSNPVNQIAFEDFPQSAVIEYTDHTGQRKLQQFVPYNLSFNKTEAKQTPHWFIYGFNLQGQRSGPIDLASIHRWHDDPKSVAPAPLTPEGWCDWHEKKTLTISIADLLEAAGMVHSSNLVGTTNWAAEVFGLLTSKQSQNQESMSSSEFELRCMIAMLVDPSLVSRQDGEMKTSADGIEIDFLNDPPMKLIEKAFTYMGLKIAKIKEANASKL